MAESKAAPRVKKAPKGKKKAPKGKDYTLPGAALASDLDEIIAAMRGVDGVDEEGVQLLGGGGLSLKLKGVIETRCATLDAAIGRGGYPRGRLTILHGKEGCGKTTLALHAIAETQARGGIACYVDAEYKLDLDYAAALGVNINALIYVTPKYLEATFHVMEVFCKRVKMVREKSGNDCPALVILDSMNASKAKAVIDGEYDDKHVATEARIFSQSLPKLMPLVHKNDISLMFISQMRTKIGIMYGDATEIAGGHAPKHAAVLILFVKRLGNEKGKEGDKFAQKTSVYVKKNQVSTPFKTCEFLIEYGKGVNQGEAILRQASAEKLVKRAGSWYKYEGEKLAEGKMPTAQMIADDVNGIRGKLVKALRKDF